MIQADHRLTAADVHHPAVALLTAVVAAVVDHPQAEEAVAAVAAAADKTQLKYTEVAL